MGSVTPRHGGQRHKIVCLDAFPCPVPKFDFPHEYVEYQNTMGEDLIIERARDATIIITSRAPVSARTIAACPRLELIAFMTTGTDIADRKACRARGIAICNAPGANSETVAEHAFALYLAARRQVVDLHRVTLEAEAWPMENYVNHLYPQLPRVLRHEVLGIIGYGAIGKRCIFFVVRRAITERSFRKKSGGYRKGFRNVGPDRRAERGGARSSENRKGAV